METIGNVVAPSLQRFFCSCWFISSVSADVGSTGAFDGGLSWFDGDGNVNIKEKEVIVDGIVSGSLAEILLVIRIPVWRSSHAASDKNSIK